MIDYPLELAEEKARADLLELENIVLKAWLDELREAAKAVYNSAKNDWYAEQSAAWHPIERLESTVAKIGAS